MRYHVNEDCIGCGLCTELCPAVFEMTEMQVAQAAEADVLGLDLDAAKEAMDSCPVGAIQTVE